MNVSGKFVNKLPLILKAGKVIPYDAYSDTPWGLFLNFIKFVQTPTTRDRYVELYMFCLFLLDLLNDLLLSAVSSLLTTMMMNKVFILKFFFVILIT